jgi:hypothetical protein
VSLVLDGEIFEAACENNRDLDHLRGKFTK